MKVERNLESELYDLKVEVKRLTRENWSLTELLRDKSPNFTSLRTKVAEQEREIQDLKEDLGSLRVLEAFMRSGVIKDLGLKDDPQTQTLLRRFFEINLKRALARPETLLLSPPPGTERTRDTAEGPENERRHRAA
jgi:predicted RNase H-like nuclease (RuvC/YqgF family)